MLFNLLNAVVKTEIKVDFNRFLESLPYFGYGLLGVFIVIGVIILATMALIGIENKIKASKKAKEEAEQASQE